LDFGLIWETKLSALFDADKIRMIPSALMLNTEPMKRYGSVIRIRPEKLEEYKRLHAEVWPGVRKMIAECGLRNYSIYYNDGYLFSYYEYVGDDYEADMAKMAADPETQRWWAVCEPCQEPLETRTEGEWWTSMEEVFHQD
jgi:L-rhamnose mutarotase